ncbi:MAG: DUF1565 domain-containing protein [Lentisphaerae bacterium]|nr:DUF1565 domain-containing protein [Lentisphaerota bacterium]
MKNLLLRLAVFFLMFSSLAGKEYFTGTNGSDSNPGTEHAPFKTIQKGVNILQPGDTLTILPGIYRESVTWRFNGSAEKPTTVRAKFAGTVLLRGDIPVSGFKKVDGIRNCYSIPLEKAPEGVNECDTQTMYQRYNSLQSGKIIVYGAYFYDTKNKQLYIYPSDGADPENHEISLSVLDGHGFSVVPVDPKQNWVKNVVIEGIAATGYSWRRNAAHTSAWGIVIEKAENCVIRNCSAYMNYGGISLNKAKKSRIENCVGIRNGTTTHVSAGNIIGFYAEDSVIDRCTSLHSVTYGIRFYGTNLRNTISNCKSLGDYRGSIWIKPDDGSNRIIGTYSSGSIACKNTVHCVSTDNEYDRSGKFGKTSLRLKKKSGTQFPDDFADPWNYDFRLQKDAAVKQGFAGGNVCFIAPDGNDSNDGKSVKTPWKTLKNVPAHATVYFLPGVYAGDLELKQDHVILSGHGQSAPAVIRGGTNGLRISGNQVTVKRLNFTGSGKNGILCNGSDIIIDRCGFANQKNAVSAEKSAEVTVMHSAFDRSVANIIGSGKISGLFLSNIIAGKGALPAEMIACNNAYRTAIPAGEAGAVQLIPEFTNAGAGDFTLKNEKVFAGKAFDGFPIGPYFILHENVGDKAKFLEPIKVSSTSANIGWSNSSEQKRSLLYVTEKGKNKWRMVQDFAVNSPFHSVSVSGLKPGTEYQYYLLQFPNAVFVVGNHYLPPVKRNKRGKIVQSSFKSAVQTFKTPAVDRPAKVWHVAKYGNNQNDGSAEKPFLTISQAAMMVQPGDTVIVHNGKYTESVFVAVSGTAEKPITFRAAPGEEVWIDGNDRHLNRGFAMFGKTHLKFDGFRFREFGTGFPNSSGIFVALGSNHIEITRCFHDGRGPGYSPGIINARFSGNITLRNSVAIGGMFGISFVNSSNITIENNVFKKVAIWTLLFFGNEKNKIRFAGNIVTDSGRAKTHEAPLKVENLASLTEENNLYFMRFPENLRKIIDFTNDGSKKGKAKKITLKEYFNLIGKNTGSYFADPGIKVLSTQLNWKDEAARKADLKKGKEFNIANNNAEDGRNPENFSEYFVWDFHDFFAPALFRTKKIGLNAALFSDISKRSVPAWDPR